MDEKSIFRRVPNYKELHVYQKAEVLVLLTDVFCKRFLPLYGAVKSNTHLQEVQSFQRTKKAKKVFS